jgi:SAM-dependent methyltransferase
MTRTSGDEPARLQYFGKDLEAMSFAVEYHRWIAREFDPYLGANVAEVGAGTGNFSALLLERAGLGHLAAFEPSANMFPLLEQRLAGAPRVTLHQAYFGARAAALGPRFDSICYVNVLEHIEDDAAELAAASSALKPGGHLLLFVPALPFLYSELDRDLGHFRRYRKPDLERLVSAAGLEIRRSKYFDLPGILPWYLAFVLLRRPLTAGGVSLYDRLVVPIARRIESALPPPVGKNLLLVARNR